MAIVMAMAMLDASTRIAAFGGLSPNLRLHTFTSSSSLQQFPAAASSQPWVGLATVSSKSGVFFSCFRDSAEVVKSSESAGNFATKAASTRMGTVAEGDAKWDEDLMAETKLHVSTQLLQLDNAFDPYDALSTPLYQTATFKQPSATEGGPYDYTRSGNPTRDALERKLAELEGADRAFCFTTGMAALTTVTRLAEAGEEIVAGDDIYGGSDRLLSRISPKCGLIVKRIDTGNLDEVRGAVGPKTKIVWIESPTNPRQMISDIREIAKIAHEHGALLIVDNSIMSPILSKPLHLGADIVMHSATKFIAGHSDVMAGVLAVKGESLAKDIYFQQNAEGTGLSPFDCWLCLRGIKTMALRVEKQQANAQKIAEFLVEHPLITRVNYAGLPKHSGRALHYSQCKGQDPSSASTLAL